MLINVYLDEAATHQLEVIPIDGHVLSVLGASQSNVRSTALLQT